MTTINWTYTNAGHNLMRDGESGANNPKITYVALGTSSTAPAVGDTKLGAEVFRKKVASYTNGANPGEVIVGGYIAPGDANGVNIQEVGFFGGSAANANANTGVLVAHGLYAPGTKTNTQSIQITLDKTD